MIDLFVITLMLFIPARSFEISPPVPITVNATLTAYSSSADETDDDPDIMANGEWTHEGAVANNCWPFGTRFLWQGKILTVKDRKNRRYGCEWFDIWHPDKEAALEFGIKRNQRLVEL